MLLVGNNILSLFVIMKYEPKRRISAEESLKHPYFQDLPRALFRLPGGKYHQIVPSTCNVWINYSTPPSPGDMLALAIIYFRAFNIFHPRN